MGDAVAAEDQVEDEGRKPKPTPPAPTPPPARFLVLQSIDIDGGPRLEAGTVITADLLTPEQLANLLHLGALMLEENADKLLTAVFPPDPGQVDTQKIANVQAAIQIKRERRVVADAPYVDVDALRASALKAAQEG